MEPPRNPERFSTAVDASSDYLMLTLPTP